MRRVRLACVFAILLVFPACGGGGGTGDDDGDDAPPPDATIPDGFEALIGREWTIPPGDEVYKCIGVRAPEDMYISAFSTVNPDGEHHAVLTVSEDPGGFGNTQLGEYDCNVNTLDLQMMFASGVGTDDLIFPDDTAIRVRAGQFVHLNLHLFNTDPQNEKTGTSSILVRRVASVTADKEVEMVFAGTFNIDIPAGQIGTASGGCTFNNPATIFTYWPHMHQAATHHKVTFTIGGTVDVIHDQDFFFDEQTNFPLSPSLVVASGDSVNVECTYDNTEGTSAITFGDSSTQEMCFTGLYRYPKQAFTLFDCSEGSGF